MDHDDARDAMEIAAAEPGGIDRLIAGDTPDAQALGGHLAGCDACADELRILRRTSEIVRAAVRMAPSPELRDRTLGLVRDIGRDRGAALAAGSGIAAAGSGIAAPPAGSGIATKVSPRSSDRADRRSRRPAPIAAVAAAIIIAVVATTVVVESRVGSELAARSEAIAALETVTEATVALMTEPGATHVQLQATTATGEHPVALLVFSPTSTRLAVVASGLDKPPTGREYRCWLEVDGRRERVGKMHFAGDVAFWVGPVAALTAVKPGTRFGISLADIATDVVDAEPVLTGEVAPVR